MGSNMTLVVESLQPAPDTGPFVLEEFGFRGVGGFDVHRGRGVGVNPLFHFYGAGAVVEFVRYVGGLGGYVADLADEGDLLAWSAN